MQDQAAEQPEQSEHHHPGSLRDIGSGRRPPEIARNSSAAGVNICRARLKPLHSNKLNTKPEFKLQLLLFSIVLFLKPVFMHNEATVPSLYDLISDTWVIWPHLPRWQHINHQVITHNTTGALWISLQLCLLQLLTLPLCRSRALPMSGGCATQQLWLRNKQPSPWINVLPPCSADGWLSDPKRPGSVTQFNHHPAGSKLNAGCLNLKEVAME